ncbi:MAG TPA: hypothetical protein VGD98_06980 [Ktedonobacteraceae bacterium]
MPFITQPPNLFSQRASDTRSLALFYGRWSLLLALLLLLNCCGTSTVPGPTKHRPAAVTPTVRPAPASTAVLTSKNDNLRTGRDDHETLLNVDNVNVSDFGKRMSYPVDGAVYAQPLFVPNLTIQGHQHNVVFVVTEHDSVFALDADQPGPALWQVSFIRLAQGITPLTPADVNNCRDLGSEIGITSTPVIDKSTDTLYVLSITKEHGNAVQRLHALDIISGQEKSGGPVTIQAAAQGSGDGSSGGVIYFDPRTANQRAALLLTNGVISIAWASYCDSGFYHGWIIGYDASSLKQVAVYNDTPDGYQGGIWQSGGGLAADDQNNLYVATGNGTYNLNQGGQDAGNSLLKLSIQPQGFKLEDYFTPFNQTCLGFPNDTDFGSGGILLLPANNGIVSAGKEGRLYFINRLALGEYSPIDDPCDNQKRTDVDAVDQEFSPGTIAGGLYGSPTYWHSDNGEYIYLCGADDHLKAFRLTQGRLTLAQQTSQHFSYPGANSALSSDGARAGNGILWVLDPQSVLHAYDAENLNLELYTTSQKAARDAMGSYVKFSVPTIANGEVFVGTQNSLLIYGLLN